MTGHRHDSRGCLEIFERLSEYLDHELDPGLCDEIDRHLDGCKPCEAFLESLRRTIDHLGRAQAEPLPEDLREQLRQAARDLSNEDRGQ